MRVLLTVPSLQREFGGPTTKARHLGNALREQGADVIVAGCGTPELGYDDRTLSVSSIGRFHATPIPRTTASIRRLTRAADVVHVIGYRDPIGTTAAVSATRARVPYVVEPTGMHRRRLRSLPLKRAFDRAIGRRVMSGAAVVVATSSLEEDDLVADGMARSRIALRPNGVDVSELLPLPARGSFRERAGIPRDARLALSLGRITSGKGTTDLIEAGARLAGVWLAIAGTDAGDGTMERIRERLRSPDASRVRLVDRGLWGREKAAAFADADVFCLPSLTENFGNAAAEAAAVGLPVVLSNACGVAEWLPQEMLRVVPYGDVGAIAAAIEDLSHADVAEKAGILAGDVRLRLDWRSLAAEQLGIYERAIDQFAGGR